ncbi:lipopolysaccharide biosynthesis protein [Pseudoalteromonas sp. MB41]|uniref:lipopolysaccharide biosynthesis protein n=1 Tax=Pseudoalteromonas sp. MB41 TaxID=2896366 RepID=UPI001E50A1B8|nr:lipopolysaccharide biosynthesis protein [Pseudoalteromonas sp. MB41]MCC9661796.1 lipopolysaccharide biosynthesis protein [Pseudoalteromonas sp. MB41]
MKFTGSKLLLISANFLYAFYQWLVLIVITRKLGLNAAGLYAFILALSAPIFLLLSFQFRNVIASKVKEAVEESLYFKFRFFAGVLATFLTIMVACLSNSYAPTMNNLAITLFICLIKLIDSIVDLKYGFYQREQSLDKLTLSLLIRGVVGSFLMAYIYFISELNLFGVLLSICLINLIVIMLIDFKSGLNFIFSKPLVLAEARVVFLSTYTLGFVAVLDSLFVNGQRYVVSFLFGYEVLAQYVSIVYILIVSQLVVTSLGQIFISKLSLFFSNKDFNNFLHLTHRLVVLSMILGGSGVLLAFFFGQEVLTLIYGKEVMFDRQVILLISLSSIPMYIGSCLGYSLLASGYYKKIIKPMVFSVFCLFILSYVLGGYFNLLGVSLALFVSYLLKSSLLYFEVLKTIKKNRELAIV